MTITLKQFGSDKFSQSGAGITLYTVPASTKAIIKSIDIDALTAVAHDVSVYLVPTGQSKADEYALFKEIELPADGHLTWTGAQILDTAGDFIFVEADADNVATIIASGVEES